MKLSNKSLKKLIKGACNFEEKNGYLISYHYSNKQLNHFNEDGYDEGWRMRAEFSGGIRIELKTNSTEISFDYKSDFSSDQNSCDIYINDVLSKVVMLYGTGKGKISFNLSNGEKKVTIYFPLDSRFEVKNFTLNGNYKSVKEKRIKTLIIGDSITQGYGPTLAGCTYVNALMRKTNLDILAQGVGGYRFEPRDLMKVDGFEPERIIVFLGTNYYEKEIDYYDYEKSTKDFFVRLREIYGKEIPIIDITPLWRNNNVDWERFEWCIDLIKGECAKYENIKIVDGFTLVPNVDECFCDKIHPNAYGSHLLAENLSKIIKQIKFDK